MITTVRLQNTKINRWGEKIAPTKRRTIMTIKIYNSSDCLVFTGDEQAFAELEKNNLINDGDRIVVE